MGQWAINIGTICCKCRSDLLFNQNFLNHEKVKI
jgi:hypothetical protein